MAKKAAKKKRGRHSKNVDFIQKLKELSDITTDTAFAKACGKKQSQMAQYLSGKAVPQRKALVSSLDYLHGWSVHPIMEVEKIPANLNTLKESPGIYVIYDSAGNVLYIGKATSFRLEVRQTLAREIPVGIRIKHGSKGHLAKVKPRLKDLAHYISLYEITSPRIRHNLESLLLRVFANQTHNSNVGTFK